MKIALCDDNKQELLHINRLLDEYSSNSLSKDKIKVSSFASSMELLAQLESGKQFDVFLLDVIMPGLNGIELATEIRSKDQVGKIIFLTTSPEFAVESYAVDAINYLLKPLQKDKFFSVIEKACHDIRSDLQQYLIIKTQGNLSKVFLRELIYIEVVGRSLYLHQNGGIIIESTSTFSQVEAVLLKDKRFLKTHRSYIVNLDYIKNLSKDGLTMTSNVSIPVSRNAFKEVKQAYINYSFGVED